MAPLAGEVASDILYNLGCYCILDRRYIPGRHCILDRMFWTAAIS